MFEKFKAMSKEEYCKKYKDGLRYSFGYDICNKKDKVEIIGIRVYLPKRIFKEYKHIEDYKEILSFQETPFFEEFSNQIIKIDFEKKEFIAPNFFLKYDIEIIPYFSSQGYETEKEINENQFFKLLKQNNAKELSYACFFYCYGSMFCEEEYQYFCKIKQ
ncbi:hypothetical protein [Campylobacter insulaenigrae]|uniref:hypothetical protein n=1 Tax=Campylobacter insulaenigrae TaxID=260714 RepID=UPI002153524C|nr:hypothetical protein [Campylobacter insulaenigrae]MCR6580351.1 hypothetical protein [Campylobacter insulaenigrae]